MRDIGISFNPRPHVLLELEQLLKVI